ncbi:MAG: hypothetical protein MK207_10840 [Saprospiraceae bacterium]|nr:hypothetical protein [Saprospiraceae bacterium]
MKSISNFFSFNLIAVVVVMAFSCNTDQNTQIAHHETIIDSKDIHTRSIVKKVTSKSYYFNSLASFQNGEADVDLNNLADLEGKQVNLVVLYASDAPWAEVFNTGRYATTGNETFNALLESYDLSIVEQFELDDESEGIVLESDVLLNAPIEVAREISLIDYVLIVQVKEIPQDDVSEETADVE